MLHAKKSFGRIDISKQFKKKRCYSFKFKNMKKISLLAILFSLLFASCQSGKELFNGKNLDGWKIHGTEKWYVEDGLLISESGPDKKYGYLATNNNYKDFEINLEFKQEADGNSGVFMRSEIDGIKITGWQIEVAPPNLHTGGIYESYGRGWLIKPAPEKRDVLKYGEWNMLKIKVKGKQITSWLNGVEMVDFSDEKIGAANGKIALQIHDGGGIKVYWRNIKLKKL
jgi:hypothetical protein